MDANVLSLPNPDAVECPGGSLRQVMAKVHEHQLPSMIKSATRMGNEASLRTQWSCNSNRVAGRRMLRRRVSNSIGLLVGSDVIKRGFGYAPIDALKKCHPAFLYRGGRPGSVGDGSPRTRGSVLHLLATANMSIQTEVK